MPEHQETILSEIIEEIPEIKTFKFQTKEKFNFIPGQFVMLRFPQESGFYEIGPRAYSISSSPNNNNYFELTIQKVGQFTTKLFETKLNQKFLFTGPHGKFNLPGNKNEIVFITGGSGITPFLSMIRDLNNNKKDVNITIFYSCKTPEMIIRKNEIEEICTQNKNIKCHFTITRPTDAHKHWNGLTGRINKDMLTKHLGNTKDKTYFLCGTKDMINSFKELLLTELSIPKDQVIIENWG